VDENDHPVDGALIKILGQSYYNPENFGTCITGCTDVNGELVLDLGDNRDFKGEVYTNFGKVGTTLIIEDTVVGENYPFNAVVPGTLDVPNVTDAGDLPSDTPKWRLTADVNVPYATLYGVKKPPTGGALIRTSQTRVEPGSVDVFLLNSVEKTAWDAKSAFNAYHVMRETTSYDQTMTMNDDHWVFAVSNRHHHGHRENVELSLVLEEYVQGAWVEAETVTRQISLDPGEIYTAEFGEGLFHMDFELPAQQFTEGDEFYLNLHLSTSSTVPVDADVYVLMDVFGAFYGYPGWQDISQGLPKNEVSILNGNADVMTILDPFIMPAVPTSGPYYFYCAAFEPGTLAGDTLVGNVDVAEFYLGE